MIGRELRIFMQRAIAVLPRMWRQAVVLTVLEGLTPAAAAAVVNRAEEDVRSDLEYARAFLRAKLADSGFSAEDAARWPIEHTMRPLLPQPMPSFQREAIAAALATRATGG